jgi:hypothetical protein
MGLFLWTGSRGNIENASSFRMGLSMRESGISIQENETVEESRSGQMDPVMRDTGKTIRPMEEEGLFMRTGMCMRESG